MNNSIKAKPALSLRQPIISASKSALLLSAAALLVGNVVHAQDIDEPIVLDTMQVTERASDTNPYAEEGAPYKAKISGDRRHVAELAKTPQTITVLTQTQIQESGKEDLRDILAAQPGISLGTGENGNAFGDRYVIRGHEARSDVFVDSIRDPGMTTRESFAVEQVEITKGPSSTFAGRGSSGGAVNSITKQASTDYDFNKLQAGVGTNDYKRFALDSNVAISEDAGVRANILLVGADVPDRAPADKKRTGFALSGNFHATEKLAIVADYYYLNAHDKPDLGSYIIRDTNQVVKDIPAYAQDEDFLDSTVSTYTVRANYKVNDQLSFQNSMRYGTTENGYVVTGIKASTRDASDPDAPGAATTAFSTHQGWQEVDYFVNQLNAYLTADLADMEHQFIFSAEYSDMNVTNGAYNYTNTGTTNCIVGGRGGVSASYCGLDANGDLVDDINNLLGREITKGDQDSDYNVETISLSAMDTVQLTDKLSAFVGVRMDHFDYDNTVASRDRATSIVTDNNYSYDDTLWNGHVGFVYQLSDAGNIYATYSTAANINGGESDVGGNCGYGGICGDTTTIAQSKPEKVENIEIGTKWNLFDEKLLATAAIFQITKSDVMEGADYTSEGTLNTGKNRVKGLEVSLVGNITHDLSIQLGASLMDSEILDSVNDDSLGKALANFADESAYAQVRYQFTPQFSAGAVATYSSEIFVGQPDSAANEELSVPSYTVFDLFANYEINEQLKLRLNVANLADKDYYLTAYRGATFAYIGAARNTKLTLSYEF